MRILLVEDNLKLASTLEDALSQAGFTVDCVHDGHAADLLLTTQDGDTTILDLRDRTGKAAKIREKRDN